MPPDAQFDLGPPGPVLGVRAYRVGRWNGEDTTPEELAELVANFARFAALTPSGVPFYVPFISLRHSDLLAFGRVTRCVMDGEYLVLDLDGVPLAFRRWMLSGQLTFPSVEVWRPGEFSAPDGTEHAEHVLRCVTLLGADAPGAKGLPPLSAAVFPDLTADDVAGWPTVPASLVAVSAPLKQYRDSFASVRKFSDLPPATRGKRLMDRTAVIKALADAGIPADGLDKLPDDTLKAMADVAAKASKAGDDDEGEKKKLADDEKKKADGDEEVKTYRDRAKRAATELESLTAKLKAEAAAATATAQQIQNRARAERVKLFRDEMTGVSGPAFMTPAQFDAVEPLLLLLDHSTVKTFADGKVTGTALDEQIGRIKAAHPTPVKKFGHQLADGKAPAAGAGGHNYTAPPARAELSEDAKAMLDSTPEGRAAFARLK